MRVAPAKAVTDLSIFTEPRRRKEGTTEATRMTHMVMTMDVMCIFCV